MNNRDGFALVVIGTGFLLLVALGLLQQLPPPDGMTKGEFFFGQNGVGGFLIGAATFVAGVVTVILLFKRARHDDRQHQLAIESGRLDQFSKGTEMLGQSGQATKIGGLIMVSSLGARHDRFFHPALLTLRVFLAADSANQWVAMAAETRVTRPAAVPANPRSTISVVEAMTLLGQIRGVREVPWPENAGRVAGRLNIADFYLGEATIQHCHFTMCEFETSFLNSVVFFDCDFSNSSMVAWVRNVAFRNCRFDNATLTILDLDNRRLGVDANTPPQVAFFDCEVNGGLINGLAIENREF